MRYNSARSQLLPNQPRPSGLVTAQLYIIRAKIEPALPNPEKRPTGNIPPTTPSSRSNGIPLRTLIPPPRLRSSISDDEEGSSSLLHHSSANGYREEEEEEEEEEDEEDEREKDQYNNQAHSSSRGHQHRTGRRHSSESVDSDFSLLSETGDLAEQLAGEEDPLRIQLRSSSFEGVRDSAGVHHRHSQSLQGGGGSSGLGGIKSGSGHHPNKKSKNKKHVHYGKEAQSPYYRPGLRKEDIPIPEPPPRRISRAEAVFAVMMTGDRDRSQTSGLTGKPLLYFTSVFVSLGVFLFGYDQGVMSGIITGPYFKDYFHHPSRAELGTMVAILEVGAFVASLSVGRIGDMIGRRRTILYGSIVFFIGGALQTFANGMPMMLLGRIVAGLGVGALSTIVPIYQSEISPPHNRGKLACIEFSGNVSGYAASVWVDYFCTYIESDYSWRIPLAVQCFMGALLGFGSLIISESPRWLLDNDHDEEGILVIANLYGGGDIHNDKARQEYREIKMNVLIQRQEGERTYREMFKKYYKRVFIAMSAQALAQLNGINVISYYAPLVFESAGWRGRDAVLMTGINAITYLLATVPPWYLVDRWGRRVILLSGAVAMIVSLSLISYFLYLDIGLTPNMVVIFVMIYNAAFGASWGPIPWLYPPEILPLSIRAKGASLSTAANWAFNWLVGEMTPILQEWIAWRLYLVHAFFCAVSFVIVYFLYPETANVRLEDMNLLFGDATTAMPTPAQHAEVESLMSRSPVPSLDIRHNTPGRFGAQDAIPGLNLDPPEDVDDDLKDGVADGGRGALARGGGGKVGGEEGLGGWISRMVRRGGGGGVGGGGGGGKKGGGQGEEGQGRYTRMDQDDD
ncbi:hypothetical protein MMC25_000926 [Agyrium rufum]|nr:hypothetical protein [Agyrium rufum]